MGFETLATASGGLAASVRRVSVGSQLGAAAYGALVAQASSVLDRGALDDDLPRLDTDLAGQAFHR